MTHLPSSPHAPATAPGTLLLVVLCAAHFMDAIDLSNITVVLPSVHAELGLSPAALGWVVTAYLLGYGGFLLLGGRTADVVGRRRVFLTAVAVFGVASMAGVLAPGAEVLVVSRFVKGIAAAFLAPAALSLITTLWPDGPERGRAIGVFAGAGAAGFVGGLVLGGLAGEVSWRLALALPVPIAVAVLLAAPRLVPSDDIVRGPRARRTPLDALGAVLVTAGFTGVLVYLAQGPDSGWASPTLLVALVTGLAALGTFVVRERVAAAPLLPLDFLRRRNTSGTSLVIATLWAAYNGFAFLATLAMQGVLGWSPLETGLAFVPIGLVNGFLAPRTGRLAGRIGAGPVVLTGVALLTVSYVLFWRIGQDSGYLTEFLPVMLINGLGIACTFAPLNLAAMDEVPTGRLGLAAAVLNTSQQLGGAAGLAIVAAVIAGSTGLSSYPVATGAVVAISATGLVAAAVLLRRRRPAARTSDER